MTKQTIYTIGHGSGAFPSLEARIRLYGITTIVDVRRADRMVPEGDFSAMELEAIAAEAGIGYRWLGNTMGGSPSTPVESVSAGIDELAGLVETSNVALLCVEPDPRGCHRSRVLAPLLTDRGYRVVHVLEDGTTALHQDELEL